MGRTAKFAMGEIKRHYKKKGPSDTQKKWMAIENLFESARECVREYEIEQERQQAAYEYVMYLREGGEPY